MFSCWWLSTVSNILTMDMYVIQPHFKIPTLVSTHHGVLSRVCGRLLPEVSWDRLPLHCNPDKDKIKQDCPVVSRAVPTVPTSDYSVSRVTLSFVVFFLCPTYFSFFLWSSNYFAVFYWSPVTWKHQIYTQMTNWSHWMPEKLCILCLHLPSLFPLVTSVVG